MLFFTVYNNKKPALAGLLLIDILLHSFHYNLIFYVA